MNRYWNKEISTQKMSFKNLQAEKEQRIFLNMGRNISVNTIINIRPSKNIFEMNQNGGRKKIDHSSIFKETGYKKKRKKKKMRIVFYKSKTSILPNTVNICKNYKEHLGGCLMSSFESHSLPLI